MKMFQIKVVGKIKTHTLYSITLFQNSCHLWYNVKKYCTSRQATDDNMAHANCMLDTYNYKYAFRLCNTFCFATATMVAWTHLKFTLYIHCLSCSIWMYCWFVSHMIHSYKLRILLQMEPTKWVPASSHRFWLCIYQFCKIVLWPMTTSVT